MIETTKKDSKYAITNYPTWHMIFIVLWWLHHRAEECEEVLRPPKISSCRSLCGTKCKQKSHFTSCHKNLLSFLVFHFFPTILLIYVVFVSRYLTVVTSSLFHSLSPCVFPEVYGSNFCSMLVQLQSVVHLAGFTSQRFSLFQGGCQRFAKGLRQKQCEYSKN